MDEPVLNVLSDYEQRDFDFVLLPIGSGGQRAFSFGQRRSAAGIAFCSAPRQSRLAGKVSVARCPDCGQALLFRDHLRNDDGVAGSGVGLDAGAHHPHEVRALVVHGIPGRGRGTDDLELCPDELRALARRPTMSAVAFRCAVDTSRI